LSDLTSVALKMSADGVPRQPDGPWSTLEQDQLKLPAPTDTAIELCASGRVGVETLLLAHNPRVFNGYGKA